MGIVTETNLFDAFLEHFGVRRGGIRVTVRAEDKPGRLRPWPTASGISGAMS